VTARSFRWQCPVARWRPSAVALDFALSHADRVAGMVLLAPAVSGAIGPEQADPDTERLSDLVDAADAAGDPAEVNRPEAWPWLHGPAGPEAGSPAQRAC
jgi:pimeloyl-ACP methyl ester carboxylesterase